MYAGFGNAVGAAWFGVTWEEEVVGDGEVWMGRRSVLEQCGHVEVLDGSVELVGARVCHDD